MGSPQTELGIYTGVFVCMFATNVRELFRKTIKEGIKNSPAKRQGYQLHLLVYGYWAFGSLSSAAFHSLTFGVTVISVPPAGKVKI